MRKMSGYVRKIRKKKILSLHHQIKRILLIMLLFVFYAICFHKLSSREASQLPRISKFYSSDVVKDLNLYEEIGNARNPNKRLRKWEEPMRKDEVKNRPIILVWQAMEYQMKLADIHLEYTQPDSCGGCIVTTNRSLQAQSSGLIHFNSRLLTLEMDVPDPSLRNPNQIYAFWSRETPGKTYSFRHVLKDPRFDGIFNITMNFRRDADIVDLFGNTEYELRVSHTRKRSRWRKGILSYKTGLAIWAVSNCNMTYGARSRMTYAKSLIEAGLNVSTYGACFEKKLESINDFENYKFYLAFENSVHCPDYVSEKFWRNGLRSATVPIVWGPVKSDVVAVAPENSFIHTDDFKDPKDLVKYINYLDGNDTAYMEYHAWREKSVNNEIADEDIQPNHRSTFCRFCKRITKHPLQHTTVPSVYKWLYETRYNDDDQLCFED